MPWRRLNIIVSFPTAMLAGWFDDFHANYRGDFHANAGIFTRIIAGIFTLIFLWESWAKAALTTDQE